MMLALSSPDERIAAVLHDVVEDCPGWTLDRLKAEGFPEHIVTALDSVTKRDGDGYETVVRQTAANPIGRRVKSEDLRVAVQFGSGKCLIW
jgi:(p)ppGpp synthase/HD superfamily hydrolase